MSWAVWTESDARSALDEAFARPIGSARVAAVLDAWADEEDAGAPRRRWLRLRVDGPIRPRGRAQAPELDWRIRVEAPGRTVDARLVNARGRATVALDGATYEASRPVLGAAAAVLGPPDVPAPPDFPAPPDPATPPDATGPHPRRWFHEVTRQGEDFAAGAATERFKASLRLDRVLEDLTGALDAVPGAALVLPPQTLPTPSERRGLAFALRGASADVQVAREDGTLRAIHARGRFRVPASRRTAARGLLGGGFSLSLVLHEVGAEHPIAEPVAARPLPDLLRKGAR
ncbi:MAG: hypothetical protein H0V55_01020 [Thermoleophilaceae bacterium]|nr:hypothetical protein [Thermoleophilaceae bacterium]